MAHDFNLQVTPEDTQMIEAFRAMQPLLQRDRYERPDESREVKKVKRPQSNQAEDDAPALQLLQAMGRIILRLDQDLQQLKRQDCWVCFMQTDKTAILPSLIQNASMWRQELQERRQKQGDQSQELEPLRCRLLGHLAEVFLQRLQKLAAEKVTDPLAQASIQTGTMTEDQAFPFVRWCSQAKKLKQTTQKPVTLARMIKYGEQLKDLLNDPNNTVKFTSLRPLSEDKMVPWMLQVSMRADELQSLLQTLQTSTVWTLLGMALKPHSLNMSRPAQELQTLLGMGKGRGKGHHQSKGRGKSHK